MRLALGPEHVVVDHDHVEIRQSDDVVDQRRVEAVYAEGADEPPRLQPRQRLAKLVGELLEGGAMQLQQRKGLEPQGVEGTFGAGDDRRRREIPTDPTAALVERSGLRRDDQLADVASPQGSPEPGLGLAGRIAGASIEERDTAVDRGVD